MKKNTQQIMSFLTDRKIIKGLYITIDPNKINQNCKLFNMEIMNSDIYIK
jgi:hypothetical protein